MTIIILILVYLTKNTDNIEHSDLWSLNNNYYFILQQMNHFLSEHILEPVLVSSPVSACSEAVF